VEGFGGERPQVSVKGLEHPLLGLEVDAELFHEVRKGPAIPSASFAHSSMARCGHRSPRTEAAPDARIPCASAEMIARELMMGNHAHRSRGGAKRERRNADPGCGRGNHAAHRKRSPHSPLARLGIPLGL